MTDLNLPDGSAGVVVGSDDVLIVRLTEPLDTENDAAAAVHEALEHVGLGGRSLVIAGDIELSVVRQGDRLDRISTAVSTLAWSLTLLPGAGGLRNEDAVRIDQLLGGDLAETAPRLPESHEPPHGAPQFIERKGDDDGRT